MTEWSSIDGIDMTKLICKQDLVLNLDRKREKRGTETLIKMKAEKRKDNEKKKTGEEKKTKEQKEKKRKKEK